MFLEEILVFNWEANITTHNLFKFVGSLTALVDIPHGSFVHSAFELLKQINIDFVFITDLKYHEKIVTYFKRHNTFTIGLVPVNYSP